MAGYFEDMISMTAVAHRVEGPDSISPYSVYAAHFKEEVFWFVQFSSLNSKVFFDLDGLADVHIQSARKEFLSGSSLEDFGILMHAAREVLQARAFTLSADVSFEDYHSGSQPDKRRDRSA
jgi:hypothetical protein